MKKFIIPILIFFIFFLIIFKIFGTGLLLKPNGVKLLDKEIFTAVIRNNTVIFNERIIVYQECSAIGKQVKGLIFGFGWVGINASILLPQGLSVGSLYSNDFILLKETRWEFKKFNVNDSQNIQIFAQPLLKNYPDIRLSSLNDGTIEVYSRSGIPNDLSEAIATINAESVDSSEENTSSKLSLFKWSPHKIYGVTREGRIFKYFIDVKQNSYGTVFANLTEDETKQSVHDLKATYDNGILNIKLKTIGINGGEYFLLMAYNIADRNNPPKNFYRDSLWIRIDQPVLLSKGAQDLVFSIPVVLSNPSTSLDQITASLLTVKRWNEMVKDGPWKSGYAGYEKIERIVFIKK